MEISECVGKNLLRCSLKAQEMNVSGYMGLVLVGLTIFPRLYEIPSPFPLQHGCSNMGDVRGEKL